MNWISIILQLVSFRKSMVESRVMIENAKAAAGSAKRAVLFGICCLLAVILFLAGLITGVIELGLQIDRGAFFSFSGLLGSALVFIFLGMMVIAAAALAFRAPAEPEIPPPPPESPEAELKRVGEQILLRFLQKLAGDDPKRPK